VLVDNIVRDNCCAVDAVIRRENHGGQKIKMLAPEIADSPKLAGFRFPDQRRP